MLQALLEDRFKLKTHRETRELPVYDLTVSRSGLKLQPPKEGRPAQWSAAVTEYCYDLMFPMTV